MTVSENKTTLGEICCNKKNFALADSVNYVVIDYKDILHSTIKAGSLVFLLHNNEVSSMQYTLDNAANEVLANTTKVIWLNRESQLSISGIDRGIQIIMLIVPYAEIHLKEFDRMITSYELGYRSRLLLEQITDKKEEKSADTFLVKSQVYELLYLQLGEIQTTDSTKLNLHYEKVILAKSIIEEDITQNHTIPELAKIVGTNEQYLKTYFKQYYNKTISQYSTETKMECAKKLIMSGEHRIADVARMTGYKHATHFTTAFKKYFGYKPNLLK